MESSSNTASEKASIEPNLNQYVGRHYEKTAGQPQYNPFGNIDEAKVLKKVYLALCFGITDPKVS